VRNTQHAIERWGVTIVALHIVVSLVHGFAHNSLHVDMKLWENIYILTVITALPLVAGFLLWRRRRRGFFVLVFSMTGSLIFGGYYHFIAAGADNVRSLGSHTWTLPFQVTAVLLALTETAGVVTGVLGLFRKR
jgi:hypothetical protein